MSAPMKVTTGIRLFLECVPQGMIGLADALARAVRMKSAEKASSIADLVSRATYAMDSDASTRPGRDSFTQPSATPATKRPSLKPNTNWARKPRTKTGIRHQQRRGDQNQVVEERVSAQRGQDAAVMPNSASKMTATIVSLTVTGSRWLMIRYRAAGSSPGRSCRCSRPQMYLAYWTANGSSRL